MTSCGCPTSSLSTCASTGDVDILRAQVPFLDAPRLKDDEKESLLHTGGGAGAGHAL